MMKGRPECLPPSVFAELQRMLEDAEAAGDPWAELAALEAAHDEAAALELVQEAAKRGRELSLSQARELIRPTN